MPLATHGVSAMRGELWPEKRLHVKNCARTDGEEIDAAALAAS